MLPLCYHVAMPDLILRNARIWTGDGATPWAEAALVREGRFASVGREADIAAPAGAATLDARGRLVVPGFIDGHAHLLATGFAMQGVDLKDVPSPEEAARRVAGRAATTPAGAWIRGAGWDQHLWQGARFPGRALLDAAAPEHPVALDHTSGHAIWVNGAALQAAGITRDSDTPFGGEIDRDAAGEPTGILRDEAMKLIASAIPHPTPAERIDALNAAIAHAHSLGVTGAHAMNVGRGEYQAVLALRDSGRLRLRIRTYLSWEKLDEWIERGIRTGDGDEMMRIAGVKFFADGALGSMTAWMLEPDAAGGKGLALLPPDELEARVRRCLEHGLATAIHAIGDRANRSVLDTFERLSGVAPELQRRIEHAQLLAAGDVRRFAALGVTASVQPIHATQDMEKADRVWGERSRLAYAYESLRAAGTALAFGSDTPVETMDPLAGVHAAVTRRNARGEPPGGWYPEQRVSIETALRSYTAGCARASGDEATLGRIATGCHADFVVLSGDMFALDDPMRIAGTRAVTTVVGGEIVYQRAG